MRAVAAAPLLALLWPLCAGSQTPGPTADAAAAAACSVPDHLPPAQLSGLWTLTLWAENGSAAEPVSRGALLLERHPEFPDSVRGGLRRNGPRNDLTALVSGDVTEGGFHLDESADGQSMSAVWDGVAQDCDGRLGITGTRRPAEGSAEANAPVLRFRLERQPGWR